MEYEGEQMNEHEWETVNETKTSITSRLKIEGGFLYHLSARNSRDVHTSMCFVPDNSFPMPELTQDQIDSYRTIERIRETLAKARAENDVIPEKIYKPVRMPSCIHGKFNDCIECYEVTSKKDNTDIWRG